MREIKFRALHEGVWYYQTLEEILTITLAAFRLGEYKTQFTGLKDKNGKEIYEGDIVKYYQPYSKKWDAHFVQWDEQWANFGLFEKVNDWSKESDWVKIQEIEIIGNIYETNIPK